MQILGKSARISWGLLGLRKTLGSVCKLELCHSERSEESRFLVSFSAKSEILRRFAPQNDMQKDFAYTL
jgi:hypothetical protein